VKSKVNCLFAVVIISGDIIIIIGSRCVVLLYFSALMASLSFLDGLNKVMRFTQSLAGSIIEFIAPSLLG